MKKKTLSIVLLSVLMVLAMLTVVACDTTGNVGGDIVQEGAQSLQIFQSDLKLTQDQVLSQIKASHLKENNGYLDSDKVVVMVTMGEDSLIDTYNAKFSYTFKSVAEYVQSNLGAQQKREIEKAQNTLARQLVSRGLIDDVKYTYSTVINAIAVETTYGNLSQIEEVGGVESVILSETYNRPTEQAVDASAIVNNVDVYSTGIFNSSSVSYTGKGTAVAVLDSGFDMSHTVFQYEDTAQNPFVEMITKQDVADVLATGEMNATDFTQNLDISNVYYNKKIPYSYDYADKDYDAFPYDSNHGTHVAGIIGGKDDVITGVAVDTQLVLMKVFPDLDEGGRTEDILCALEDAVLLNVDAINMSLGSSCGFTREVDEVHINEVYDAINLSGISLICAASNDYSSAYGGEGGNTNKATNPDSGTVGSPSTYAAALSVASISGTKSRYIIGNDSQVFFFNESNSITGKPNKFVEELGITEGQTKDFDYVTIPGSGIQVNYRGLDVKGKIALVRRGDNTFEEKAAVAKKNGAVACIIYNNVEGDILMSMGKSDHIPTISISKEDGEMLAKKSAGKLTIAYKNQAGPFMSDFSSWGPTSSLEMKPEITAHGGNIKSAVHGGGYDELSGTSMATPNLCGIVILIRQYLKEKYPEKTWKEISVLTNQMLMSTATIILDQQGNPYATRKQGAGLASLYNVVNTDAYLSVDGKDRSKLELKDDPQKEGVYTFKFNLVNISDKQLSYDLSLVALTESVSTSDEEYVAEKSNMLSANYTASVEDGVLNGNTVTVEAYQTAKITMVYTMTDADKQMIDNLFSNGMYVEGFAKLASNDEGIDLNIPFLAFYGDWTKAPMFDKTYYEVETEAHDPSIDDDEKIKADYFATTPYGSYFYNYLIPLGTYLYEQEGTGYDPIPATEDHIAISNILGTIDGIQTVYAGLLRGAKEMNFQIVDKLSGEVVWEETKYNAQKAHYNGMAFPYYENLKIKSYPLGLVNNRQYTFTMKGKLDYGDGGVDTNQRNTFSFDFYLDDEAPILKDVKYEKEYDRTLKKDRFYMTMTIYDNQHTMSISPLRFTSSSTYTLLTENPIPVYSERGKDSVVRFEITDYLKDLGNDAVMTSGLAFSIDDYALNSNIYICQLPGTRGDFKFTEDGTMDGEDMAIVSVYEDEVLDLTQYLATADTTVDKDKDYLKTLVWTSSNETLAKVQDGIVWGLKKGRVRITVQEQMDLKEASITVNVKERAVTAAQDEAVSCADTATDTPIKEIRFSYFDTVFAYDRAAQTSEIGETGSINYLTSMNGISFYPGEQIRLHYDVEPWYVQDKYEMTFSSTDPSVASVDENGNVLAIKEGSAIISLRVSGSNLMARVAVNVKNPFIIENRMLMAYKGVGDENGVVVIPDDEGILYIASYAFCLYTTDNQIEVGEDDYDANKIPNSNNRIKSVVIPDGVEDIQKYAFYNCTNLESVTLPKSVKYVRDYAFYNNTKLKTIDLSNVETIGARAFYNCVSLEEAKLDKALAIGVRTFEGCTALETVDLTALRNTGAEAFKDCTSLASVTLDEHTKLSAGMFVNCGLTSVDIFNRDLTIPDFCFSNNKQLTRVTIHNDLVGIGVGSFDECDLLEEVNFMGTVDNIGAQAFYNDVALETITLPNNSVTIGANAFNSCSALTTIVFGQNTSILSMGAAAFANTALSTFSVESGNANYSADGNFLLDAAGTTIVLAANGVEYGDLTIDAKYVAIAPSAFAGTNVVTLTFTNENLSVGAYAFAGIETLTKVTFPASVGTFSIGERAFNGNSALTILDNLVNVKTVADYAFAVSAVKDAVIGENATYGEGAFFQSKLETATIGANATFGLGAFQNCAKLTTVNMPEGGGVEFGPVCFAYDTLLASIDLSKVMIIPDQAFYGCIGLRSVNLDMATQVGKYAFADCTNISTILIPNVSIIGEGAFSRYDEYGTGAPRITQILLPSTLATIGDGAFLGCELLETIEIPSSVSDIGDFTFAYCMALKTVTLPSSVTHVGTYTFAGCSALTQINLENVQTIADYAFTSSTVLANVNFASVVTIGFGAFAQTAVGGVIVAPNLEQIGDYAFQNTKIVSFTAPNLATIGIASLQGNTLLSEFVFSNDVEKIGQLAFDGCTNLASFYYLDDTKKATGTINDYAVLDGGVLYTYMPSGKLQLSAVPSALNVETLVVREDAFKVEGFAGNENKNIKKIVLPDNMATLGEYAFYGYSALETVEFKSFTAPKLEDSYNSEAVLEPGDPGYELLHNQFNVFGYELYYYNFVDLVGKKQPLKMILPSNKNIEGYDSLVYLVYFGSVADAERSSYEAREKYLVNFYEYAKQISQIETITLSHETLVNNALGAYNAITQDPFKFGYDETEWNGLVKDVNDAKATILDLKLATASQKVKDIQAEIDLLPTTFNIGLLSTLQDIAEKINNLELDDRSLLNLTQYNQLIASYNAYRDAVQTEVAPLKSSMDAMGIAIAVVAMSAAGVALALVGKKMWF